MVVAIVGVMVVVVVVMSVVFSPDVQHVVSSSYDRKIHVWNATVAFTPDGQHIVSGLDDREIHLWNAMAGETETAGQVDFTDQSKINDEGGTCGSTMNF